jgi:hypothetical protein
VIRLLRKQRQERKLHPAIAFAERMNGVDLGEEVSGFFGELVLGQSRKLVLVRQVIEQLRQFSVDVLGVAERISALGNADGAQLSSPRINVLK